MSARKSPAFERGFFVGLKFEWTGASGLSIVAKDDGEPIFPSADNDDLAVWTFCQLLSGFNALPSEEFV